MRKNPLLPVLPAILVLALLFTAAWAEETPGDSPTRAFPVAAGRTVTLENPEAETVLLATDDRTDPIPCLILPEGPARLRLTVALGDDPAELELRDGQGTAVPLMDLLDPARCAFLAEQAVPGAGTNGTDGTDGMEGTPFAVGMLCSRALGDADPDRLLYFLVGSRDALPAVEAELRRLGAKDVRLETAPAQVDAPRGYVLHVTDQAGQSVAGLYANFCTDTACTMLQSGEDGVITFDGAPDTYHVQLLRAPKGCRFDPDFQLWIGPEAGQWQLQIHRD